MVPLDLRYRFGDGGEITRTGAVAAKVACIACHYAIYDGLGAQSEGKYGHWKFGASFPGPDQATVAITSSREKSEAILLV